MNIQRTSTPTRGSLAIGQEAVFRDATMRFCHEPLAKCPRCAVPTAPDAVGPST
jgi:hypothetical protein